jgi:AraC family transcriptional regulator, arabinose operon regulatory protein
MSSLNDYGAPLTRSTVRQNQTERPYGVLSSTMKDHLYLLGNGMIFTSPWVVAESLMPRSTMILLTTGRATFDVGIAGTVKPYNAVAIKPLVARSVRAINAQLVNVQYGPLHPQFRLFRGIPEPGSLALNREAFAPLDEALEAAYEGRLSIDEAYALFENIIKIASAQLPKVKPADPRVERAIDSLRENPNRPLDELAGAAGLSYGRMSQLFTETVGISLRSYQLYLKLLKAVRLRLLPTQRKLSEIAHAAGFTDLAHMSRVFQQSYGAPMSYFMNDDHVLVFRKETPSDKVDSVVPHPPPTA